MKKLIISLLVTSLLFAFIGCSSGSNQGTDNQALQNQINQLQTQLAQSQQNVTQLQAQLTQAQQQITSLQTKLIQQTQVSTAIAPVLQKGPEVDAQGNVWGGGYASVPIDLNQNEQVQGEITHPSLSVIVQDPNGATVKQIDSNPVTQFSFTATKTGRYLIVMNNASQLNGTAYSLKYWIYSSR